MTNIKNNTTPLFNYRTFKKMTCKRLLKYIIFWYHWRALIERNIAIYSIFSKTQNSENQSYLKICKKLDYFFKDF